MASGDSTDTIEVIETSYAKKHSRNLSGIKQVDGKDDGKCFTVFLLCFNSKTFEILSHFESNLLFIII